MDIVKDLLTAAIVRSFYLFIYKGKLFADMNSSSKIEGKATGAEATQRVSSIQNGDSLEPQTEAHSWSEQFKELKSSARCTVACLGCAFVAVLIGYDLNLIGSIIANKEFVRSFGQFDDTLGVWILPADRQLAWTISQFLAAILGAALVGQFSDRFGRRLCVFINIL